METMYSVLVWVIVACHVVWSQEEDCNSALGMKSRMIPDDYITASSSLSAKHSPAFARLSRGRQGAWCSALEKSPYIQISLDGEKLITEVDTQGSIRDLRFAKRYDVKYLKGKKWISYNKRLIGNRNCGSVQKNRLKPLIRTTSIRIYPKEPVSLSLFFDDVVVPCLRLELYGCSVPESAKRGGEGFCFKKYDSKTGECKKLVKTDKKRSPKKMHKVDCCISGGKGWSARKRDRAQCEPCSASVTEPAKRGGEGFCFKKYDSKTGECKKLVKTDKKRSPKKMHKVDCCISGGKGWSARKRDRAQCEPCSTSVPGRIATIQGSWGEWALWSECSLTCGLGRRTRDRPCDNPKPKYGDTPCNEAEKTEFRFCREQRCAEIVDSGDYSGSGSGWVISSGGGSGSGSSESGSGDGGQKTWSDDDEDY